MAIVSLFFIFRFIYWRPQAPKNIPLYLWYCVCDKAKQAKGLIYQSFFYSCSKSLIGHKYLLT